jgi:ubiquinone/menaquinone biosynthesis C-methylase UbiE
MAELNGLFFDSIAEEYDDWLYGVHRRVAACAVELAGSLPGDRVLDVGCGTGLLSRLLAHDVAPEGRVVGVDSSEGMLGVARRQPVPGLTYFHAAVEGSLWFQDGSFDVISLCDSLPYLEDPRTVLQEAYRMLRDGGRLLLAVPRRSLLTEAQELSRRVLERALQAQPMTLPRPHAHHSLLGEPDLLEQLLAQVGFKRRVFRTFVTGVRVTSSEEWLEVERMSSPRAHILLSTVGTPILRRLSDQIDSAMRRLDEDGYRHHQAFSLVVARR